MNSSSRWRRPATALASLAALVPLAIAVAPQATASAAPVPATSAASAASTGAAASSGIYTTSGQPVAGPAPVVSSAAEAYTDAGQPVFAQLDDDTDITNPALHPYPITVTIDGETYHDGLDTLPGYDDYSCSPIPDVQYDFADNEILYYNDSGTLLATAHWTEWQRISSYATWEAQQAKSQSSTTTTSTTSSATTTSTTATSRAATSATSTTASSTATSSTAAAPSSTTAPKVVAPKVAAKAAPVSKLKASKVWGAVSTPPTTKVGGRYTVWVVAPHGGSVAAGKVTLTVKKGSTTETVAGQVARGYVTVTVPRLARGTWTVGIAWTGDSHYQAAWATGAVIKVTK